MGCYVTQAEESPYNKQYRNYSVNEDFDAHGLRKAYGEHYVNRLVTPDELSKAKMVQPGEMSYNDFRGLNCTDVVGYEIDGYIYYVFDEVYVTTYYRYRVLVEKPEIYYN